MQSILILRLDNGEDVISFVTEVDDYFYLSEPLSVLLRLDSRTQKRVLIMNPWLPYSILKDNSAIIHASKVLSVLTPSENFVNYYSNVITSLHSTTVLDDNELDKNDIEELLIESQEAREMNQIH